MELDELRKVAEKTAYKITRVAVFLNILPYAGADMSDAEVRW